MTVNELKERADELAKSQFGNGKPVLYCVEHAYFSSSIHSELYSRADKALERFNSIEHGYRKVYPVIDIWDNPEQIRDRED